jgi:hypothetical protein
MAATWERFETGASGVFVMGAIYLVRKFTSVPAGRVRITALTPKCLVYSRGQRGKRPICLPKPRIGFDITRWKKTVRYSAETTVKGILK